MSVTAESPEPSEYRSVANALRAPLNQSKLLSRPVTRATAVVDDEIQRRVDKAIGELEEL
jgi:hypothetical protein